MCHKLTQLLIILFTSIVFSQAYSQDSLSHDKSYTKVFENTAGCSDFDLVNGSSTQENARACAAVCNGYFECQGFSYNPIIKDCRLKVTSFCMNQGKKEIGYAYYTRNSKWSDALDQEVIILKSKYQKVADGDCQGSVLPVLLGGKVNLSTCAQLCNETNGCKGISYSQADSKCVLKSIDACPVNTRERGYYQFYGRVANI